MTDSGGNQWLDRIRAFAEHHVRPAAAGWSLGESPSRALYAEAARLGLFGIEVPTALGGEGLGFTSKVAALESLAAADFGFAMSLVNTHNLARRLAASAPDPIRSRYLPDLLAGRMSACTALTEPGAGSDLAAIATTAERAGDGWVLNGEKSWIVNGRHAGLALVFAQTAARTTDPAAGLDGLGAFLVDLAAQGVSRHAIDSGFSQTSIATGGFTLDAVRLAEDRLILAPGTAFRSIIAEINGARAYVAAMCCGMLDAALATVAAYGRDRNVFGRRLADQPAWRQVLAEAETALAAIRDLTAQAVAAVAQGENTRTENTRAEDDRLAAARAKIAAVEAGQRHLPALLHAMGAEGLRPEHCLTRHLAAMQSAALTDGATGLLKQQVAKRAGPAPATVGA